MTIGVLFGFGGKIEGDSWFTWWFNHLPGKPIYLPSRRTPMIVSLVNCSPLGKSLERTREPRAASISELPPN